MKKLIVFTFLFSLVNFIPVHLFAQSSAASNGETITDELSPDDIAELERGIKRSFSTIANIATVLTSSDTIAGGYFKADNDDQDDSKIDVIKIPFSTSLCYTDKDVIQPFISGSVGYAKATESIPNGIQILTGELQDFTTTDSLSASIGGGINYRPIKGLTLTPEVSFSVSRIENHYDFNNSFSQVLLQPFDKVLFNWHLNVFTAIPSFKTEYDLPVEFSVIPTVYAGYSFLYNRIFSSSNDLGTVTGNSGVSQIGARLLIPTEVEVLSSTLNLRPFYTHIGIYGQANDGILPTSANEIGLDFVLPNAILKEFSVGGSYTFSEDFNGFRFGIGFKI